MNAPCASGEARSRRPRFISRDLCLAELSPPPRLATCGRRLVAVRSWQFVHTCVHMKDRDKLGHYWIDTCPLKVRSSDRTLPGAGIRAPHVNRRRRRRSTGWLTDTLAQFLRCLERERAAMSRQWVAEAIRTVEGDARHSADTHLVPLAIPALPWTPSTSRTNRLTAPAA